MKVVSLKPGVGQYIAIHTSLLPAISPLLISTLPIHSPAFFPEPLLSFSRVSCGYRIKQITLLDTGSSVECPQNIINMLEKNDVWYHDL